MGLVKEPTQYTVTELKAVLRVLNLSSTGTKSELIARLSATNANVWESMPELLENSSKENIEENEVRDSTYAETHNHGNNGVPPIPNDHQIPDHVRREIELLRREKLLLEREVQMLTRENSVRSESSTHSSNVLSRSNVSINSISGLLSEFQGDDGLFTKWKTQAELLRRTYNLDEDSTRILIGSKLKGKALKWFHSKAEHLELSIPDLFQEMAVMFDYLPNRLALRK